MTATTDALVERLRAKRQVMPALGGGYARSDGSFGSYITDDGKRYVNPDGPEAANRIEALLARIEAAEKALEPLLKGWAAFTDDGTGWGNHEEAYQCLAKGMDEHWSAAAQWQAGREGVG